MSTFEDFMAAQPKADTPSEAPQLLASQPSPGAPLEQAGYLSSLGAGLGHGFGSTILGAQQLLGHGINSVANFLSPSQQTPSGLETSEQPEGGTSVGNWLINDANNGIRNLNQQFSPYQNAHSTTAMVGDIGGNVAATLPLAAIGKTATLGQRLLSGAGAGAGSAALSAVDPNSQDYWGDKALQIGVGAGFGSGGTLAAEGIGKAISGVGGVVQRRLADAGITLTPGQIFGDTAAKIEDKLTSVPILGDLIKNAQNRSVQTFNQATYNEALKPIGASLASDIPAGSDAISQVSKKIGDVYKSIEPQATFVADQNFANDLSSIRATLAQTAPEKLPQFENIVQNQITDKLNNGALDGAQWGATRSMISGLARKQVLGNATADSRALGDALDDLTEAVNAGVMRSSSPDVISTLSKANAAWARYKQIESAAGMAGASNQGNIFTPAQFMNAVRKGSTASQKATNSGLSAGLGSDAQQVLGMKYPDSGTPGRAALGAGLAALAGHEYLPAGVLGPAVIGGSLLAAPYTSYGQKLAQTLLMRRPAGAQAVAQAVNGLTRPVAPLLGAALANGANP